MPSTQPAAVRVEKTAGTGVEIDWNDGHNTGIYSFDYLRKVCPCEACKEVRVSAETAQWNPLAPAKGLCRPQPL